MLTSHLSQLQEACVKEITLLPEECFGKSGISQKAFYSSALLQRYVENGSSQVVGCECALQKKLSLQTFWWAVHSVFQHKS